MAVDVSVFNYLCSFLNTELASNTVLHTVTVGDVKPEQTHTDRSPLFCSAV